MEIRRFLLPFCRCDREDDHPPWLALSIRASETPPFLFELRMMDRQIYGITVISQRVDGNIDLFVSMKGGKYTRVSDLIGQKERKRRDDASTLLQKLTTMESTIPPFQSEEKCGVPF